MAPRKNPNSAAFFPSAAIGSLILPAADGLKIRMHRSRVLSLSADKQEALSKTAGAANKIAHADLSAERYGEAWPQLPASTTRLRSQTSIADAEAKGVHAEPFTAPPRILAGGMEKPEPFDCKPLLPENQIQETFFNLRACCLSSRICRGRRHTERTAPFDGKPHTPMRQTQNTETKQCACCLSSQICRGKRQTDTSSPFQIQIRLISGKTMLQWVNQLDLVQNLKHALSIKLGIPSAAQRLLHNGKQLEDPFPICFYGIKTDASIILTLRLRGGAAGESSTAKAFSYKDAVHAKKPEKLDPQVQAPPKPFQVDKSEEVPSVEISYPDLADDTQQFAERAIICRFNGLWPRSKDLQDWIKDNWTHRCKTFFCAKGYFIVLFDNLENYEEALEEGPWFMGSAGLFLTPWFPDFDPASAVITKAPVWIRLPNLPIYLWRTEVYRQIGNTLGCFLMGDFEREYQGLYTYARICVELDLSKGLPEQINLKIKDTVWTQFLDYENTAFRCRHCHLTGHLQNSCPSHTTRSKKGTFAKTKPKRWAPCPPPPSRSSSSPDPENGISDSEPDQASQPMDPPMENMGCTQDMVISQKRAHETSSESEKEFPMSENSNLQVVLVHPPQNGWTKVNKKKGKKQCVVASTPMG